MVFERMRAFFRRNRLDDELAEEIRLHIELRRGALIADGMAADEAEREARRQFGNVTAIRERAREEWIRPWIASIVQDVRFATRLMTRNPGLSAIVVLTVAVGAGVNAALFFALNNMLLRSPDLTDPDTLVWLDDGRPLLGPTYPDYVDYRDRTAAFEDLAAYATTGVSARLPGDEQPRTILGVMASGNYFSVLKTRAALGRTFDHADDQPPLGTATVVLSDAYWARRFNRDPAVIGRTIELNTRVFTIVGVLPREFKGARSPSGNPHVPDVWVPLWCQPLLEPGDARLRHRTTWWGLQAIGRLRAGMSLQEARTRVATVAAALDSDYPGQRRPRAPWVSRLTDIDLRLLQTEGAAVVGVLSTVSLFVMLIACANVAGLLLARASSRRKEIAVRLSLGAGRGRIVRQFVAEGLLLSGIGTVLGCIAASWILSAVVSSGGTQPLMWSFLPDGRVITFAAFLAGAATISTGLMPALQASKTELLPALTRSEGVRIGRLRTLLIGTEVAASVVLLLATALLIRGVIRAHSMDPGMPVDRLLAIDIDARVLGYEPPRLEAALRAVRREIESIPGVVSTSMVNPAPFDGSRHSTTLRLADAPDSPGVRQLLASVSASFFEAAGMQLVRGRLFDERASDEIVINQSLASRLWPTTDPLGARVTSGDFNRSSYVVVGIVRDAPYRSLRERNDPFMFRPGTGGTILVRTAGPASSVVRPASDAGNRVDRQLVISARPLTDELASELQAGRTMTLAAAALGLFALLVALAGVAATAAQSVAQRTQEIGIRMALGAQQRDAVGLIIRRTLTPVIAGAIAGLAVASQASRVLVTQLYGVSRLDPLAFTVSIALIVAAGAAAAWFPARRAATIDPIRTLRAE